MKVTVCELSNNWINVPQEQDALFSHLATRNSDFLLLPEMPFSTWLAGSKEINHQKWKQAVDAHEQWINRLQDLKVSVIGGTRPVLKNSIPHNEAFIWTPDNGAAGVHEKYYLPDEEGFWEATWYRRGNGNFETMEINSAGTDSICVGFLICTELWFNEKARTYGQAGMDILACPRATPVASSATWLAGGQAAANVSGAFCLSSNFNGPNTPSMDFGGTGWVIEPEEGEILGTTTPSAPFLTIEIDPKKARAAKKTYPRYVKD